MVRWKHVRDACTQTVLLFATINYYCGSGLEEGRLSRLLTILISLSHLNQPGEAHVLVSSSYNS